MSDESWPVWARIFALCVWPTIVGAEVVLISLLVPGLWGWALLFLGAVPLAWGFSVAIHSAAVAT